MASRWGFGWMGSKNAIAEEIVDILPAGECLVDLFAGGCAITHCAMVKGRGKWKRFIANDLKGTAVFFKEAIEGKVENLYEWVSREDFVARRDHDVKVMSVWSFGNSGRQYLWGYDKMDVKLAAFKMLTLPTVEERYAAYREFVTELEKYNDLATLKQIENIARLQCIKQLQSLEVINGIKRLEQLQSECLTVYDTDYRQVPISAGAVVYADPPYANTGDYGTDFDSSAFWQWADAQSFPVFVSEYTAPEGFTEIWSINKRCTMKSALLATQTTERLFVQERYAERYKPKGMPQTGELFGGELDKLLSNAVNL